MPPAAWALETSPLNKIGGFLKLASNLPREGNNLAMLSDIMEIYPEGDEPSVGVVIRTYGPLWELREMGITLRSSHGNVATATVPLSQLETIANLDSVVSIEPSMIHRALHDMSIPETRADEVHSGSPPFTGRGVIVGILDTGINVNHDDFKDESGKTRILFLWDQLVNRPEVSPDPPVGYDYGIEYTAEEIDAGECTHVDDGGHGTHVSGSVAGDGSSTGGKYKGMAYEADIIFVDCFGPAGAGTSGAYYLDGIDYIKRKAESLGKPYVINMSLGGNYGPHDGSTATEQAINNDVDSGATIVIAAGNEGNDKLHAAGRVPTAGYLDFEFNVPSDMSRAGIDIWYDGNDALQLSIIGPNTTLNAIPPENGDVGGNYTDAAITVERAHPSELNGDNQYLIYMSPPEGGTAIAAGDWKLRFEPYGGDPLAGGGDVDAWIYSGSGYIIWTDANDESPSITLGTPGTAEQAITVGAYITKTSWKSNAGNMSFTTHYDLGEIAWFSSRGPTRTAAYNKPEITAPGCAIVSVLAPESNEPDDMIIAETPADQHLVMYGTSMAAPHVCGGIALMLQKNPDLTPRQIKEALINSVKSDTFTGTGWNGTFGYGKMDIKAAVDRVSLPEGTDPYGTITLVPVSSQLDADGESKTTVLSEIIKDASGNTVPDGHRFTVSIVYGNLFIHDTSAESTVTEFEVLSSNGTISFELQAGDLPGKAKLEAESKKGNAYGTLVVTMTTLGSQNQGSGTGPEGVSCFIATAAFSHPLAGEVIFLKRFRDRFLLTNIPGRAFVDVYYSRLGPPAAGFINRYPLAKSAIRTVLKPVVAYARWALHSSERERWMLAAAMLALLTLTVSSGRRRRKSQCDAHHHRCPPAG